MIFKSIIHFVLLFNLAGICITFDQFPVDSRIATIAEQSHSVQFEKSAPESTSREYFFGSNQQPLQVVLNEINHTLSLQRLPISSLFSSNFISSPWVDIRFLARVFNSLKHQIQPILSIFPFHTYW